MMYDYLYIVNKIYYKVLKYPLFILPYRLGSVVFSQGDTRHKI